MTCAVYAAHLTDVRTVSGTTAKTVDGDLADWDVGEIVISRGDYRSPGLSGWDDAFATAKADVYASYANYHLYLAVDMDNISSDVVSDSDFSGTGVEVYILLNKSRQDTYCWQLIAHQQQTLVQRIYLRDAGGMTEENDTSPDATSFFGGAVTAAHTVDVSGLMEERYLRAEWDIDLGAMAAQAGGLDLFDGDTIAIAVFARGQQFANDGMIWGGDAAGILPYAWLPFQDDVNSQQGFTGGLEVTLGAATSCDQVQLSDMDPSDVNGDCVVNLLDYSMLVSTWLQCSDPDGVGCSQF